MKGPYEDGPRCWAYCKFGVFQQAFLRIDFLSQVEFDSPKELLKNENGKLRSLVDESGDREALYAMAKSTTAVK